MALEVFSLLASCDAGPVSWCVTCVVEWGLVKEGFHTWFHVPLLPSLTFLIFKQLSYIFYFETRPANYVADPA